MRNSSNELIIFVEKSTLCTDRDIFVTGRVYFHPKANAEQRNATHSVKVRAFLLSDQ